MLWPPFSTSGSLPLSRFTKRPLGVTADDLAMEYALLVMKGPTLPIDAYEHKTALFDLREEIYGRVGLENGDTKIQNAITTLQIVGL